MSVAKPGRHLQRIQSDALAVGFCGPASQGTGLGTTGPQKGHLTEP